MQLYAWGFSPAALFLVVLLALLPWVFGGPMAVWAVAAVAALVFVVWRVPSGNVWDALLDPWLFLALQVWVLKQGLKRYKKRS
jgi:hypothetical protein